MCLPLCCWTEKDLTSKPDFNGTLSRGAWGSVNIAAGGAIVTGDWIKDQLVLLWVRAVFRQGSWERHDPFAGIIQIKFILTV